MGLFDVSGFMPLLPQTLTSALFWFFSLREGKSTKGGSVSRFVNPLSIRRNDQCDPGNRQSRTLLETATKRVKGILPAIDIVFRAP